MALTLVHCSALVLACSASEGEPGTTEAALRARVDTAIAESNLCAAVDALFELAAFDESRSRWQDTLSATERGIDAWLGSEAVFFLEREEERARRLGYEEVAAEFQDKVQEAKASISLWLEPGDDPKCERSPPSIGLAGARLMAIRAALRSSDRDSAARHLERLRYEIPHGIARPTPEQELELESLREQYEASSDAS